MFSDMHPVSGETPNTTRAAWAESAANDFAVLTYGGRTFGEMAEDSTDDGSDAYTCLKDLITDLMHLAKINGWDAQAMVDGAVGCFEEELSLESGQ